MGPLSFLPVCLTVYTISPYGLNATAVCGKVKYFFGSSILMVTFTNIPGANLCCGLSIVASTSTLRVFTSTPGLLVVSFPVNVSLGNVSVVIDTKEFKASCANDCCGI